MLPTLTEILSRYPDTDKGTLHSYDKFYSELLEPKRLQVQTVLEVGVREGGSLKSWKDYFPNATHVIGIDNGEEKGVWKPNVAGIEVLEADTTKPESVAKVMNRFSKGFFDLIVDDGLHRSWAQACTYGLLRPYLAPGGIYIIEDIEHYSEGEKMQKIFGGTLVDLRANKNRHDDVILYFTN